MSRRLAALPLVLLLGIGLSQPVQACSCVTIGAGGETDYTAVLRNTDAVFRGTVLQVQDLRLPTVPPTEGEHYLLRMVVFDVDAAWRGVDHRRVFLFTGQGGGDCGYRFKEGTEYIVWATREGLVAKGELSTSICTDTLPVQEASDQLKQLGKPKRVRE